MFDEPFDLSMLTADKNLIILCPTKALEREVAALLDEKGFRYPREERISDSDNWEDYRSRFCYYIRGGVVFRGGKPDPLYSEYNDYMTCVYDGMQTEDEIEEAAFYEMIKG